MEDWMALENSEELWESIRPHHNRQFQSHLCNKQVELSASAASQNNDILLRKTMTSCMSDAHV